MAYPKSNGTVRPWRWWNPVKKKQYAGRNFSDPQRAKNGAVIECWNYLALGESIEVYNASTGRHIRTYTSCIVNGKAGLRSDQTLKENGNG